MALSTTVPCGLWQLPQSSLTGSWLCTKGPRFGVALVAGLDDAVALDQLGPDRSVRVVAIRAGHLAFKHRVVRRGPRHPRALLPCGR